jgi:lipopolysaccharide export system protein LptA
VRSFLVIILISIWVNAQTVNITSDEMKANQEKKEIIFIGNAKVVQDKSYIYANKIIVYFSDDNKTKQYDAIDNVHFEFVNEISHYKGYANKLTYMPLQEKYILTGNAKIDDLINKRVIKGDKITLDTKSGNASVKGSRKKPVKFIFETESKK